MSGSDPAASEPPLEDNNEAERCNRQRRIRMRLLNLREMVKQRATDINIKTAPKRALIRKVFGEPLLIDDLTYHQIVKWYNALEQWDAEESAKATAEKTQAEIAGA